MLRAAVVIAVLAIAVTGCGSSSPSRPQSFEGAAYPAGVRAPDFAFADLSGQPVSLSSQRGHVVALTFLPSDCRRTCVLVAEQIRGALDELGGSANVRVVFVGAVSRGQGTAFLSRTSLLGRASYLTAEEARLRPVWRAYHVAPHSEDAIAVLLIDEHGFQRVAFGIEQITPESLAHDIRLLEAG